MVKLDPRSALVALVFAALTFAVPSAAWAGTPGVNGVLNVTTANTIVNLYDTVASAASGSTITTTNIANLQNGALGNVAAGSVLLIYQAQGATISTTNSSAYGAVTAYGGAGFYEFVTVGSVSGNVITLAGGCTLHHTYNGSSQLVRVPQYSAVTVASGGTITARAWNGATGGIVALNVSGTLTLNDTAATGSINVTGLGFRGAVAYANSGLSDTGPYVTTVSSYAFSGETGAGLSAALGGQKGEGIAGGGSFGAVAGADYGTYYDTNFTSRYGRGAPANGGGGGDGHNSGGGGGSNGDNGSTWYGQGILDATYTAWYSNTNSKNPQLPAGTLPDPGYANMTTDSGGGRGGYSFGLSVNSSNDDGRRAVGGLGGRPMNYASGAGAAVYFGGGGGASDENNANCSSITTATSGSTSITTAGCSGGNGGGAVFLTVGAVAGSGGIVANGAGGGNGNDQDPGGGGGAGGSVVVVAGSGSVASIGANGGTGGSVLKDGSWSGIEAEGPGGGGGGGYVAAPATTVTIGGGSEGLTMQTPVTSGTDILQGFAAYGATIGATGLRGTTLTAFPNVCTSPVVGAAKAVSYVSNGDRTYTATYSVVIQNYGDTPLSTVVITDNLNTTFASNATYANVTAPTQTAATGGPNLTYNASFNGNATTTLVTAGTLPVGSSATFTFSVKITPTTTGPLTFSNSLSVTAAGTSGTGNGQSTSDLSDNGTNPDSAGYGVPNQTSENVATPLNLIGEPTIQKTVRNVTTGEASGLTADTASPGNTLQYTLTFTNSTGGPMTGVSFKDTVPANTTYVGAACGALASGITACSASMSAGIVTWTLTGTLANGATQTVTFNVTVN
ncbi:MAG: hypothetical protein WCE44_14370 [Candidatus Velthaea sp.]|jgi:uncharacterized repeat protein (TIGR01451 family)